ncbi:MAG TPA: RIP metalloprotease RseP, partial [Mobilitalea sp.]|nr:RIP metalloprotease RseP [Mobilitalea sp.]
DRVTAINGSPIHFGQEIFYYFYFDPVTEKPIDVSYIRDGKTNKATVEPTSVSQYLLGCTFSPQDGPAVLDDVYDNYPLALAGLTKGDTITALNGTKVASGTELHDYLLKNPLKSAPISITYQKNGEEKTVSVTPKLYTTHELGWNYNISPQKVSALNVVKYSFYYLKFNIVNTIKSIGALVTGKVSVKEIAGPVGIVNAVGQIVSETKSYGIGIILLSLMQFSILISANLGVMNLLPIPALDGGRLVFLLVEAIRGKPIAKEKEAMVHFVGMAALMVLMVFVMFNDIRNIFG